MDTLHFLPLSLRCCLSGRNVNTCPISGLVLAVSGDKPQSPTALNTDSIVSVPLGTAASQHEQTDIIPFSWRCVDTSFTARRIRVGRVEGQRSVEPID